MPEQIRTMTMADINRLMNHWRKYPPVREFVAMFIGFEVPSDEPENKPMTAEEFKRMFAITGGRVAGMS